MSFPVVYILGITYLFRKYKSIRNIIKIEVYPGIKILRQNYLKNFYKDDAKTKTIF